MGSTFEDMQYEISLEDDYKYHTSGKAFDDMFADALDDAIYDAIYGRIFNYYLDSNNILLPAYNSLKNARNHVLYSPTSTLIYSAITLELIVKNVVFKPLIYGVINNNPAAEIISSIIFNTNRSPLLFNNLNAIVLEFTKIDFNTYKRRNSKITLWKEMDEVRINRNRAVHEGKQFLKVDGKKALSIALHLYNLVTTKVLGNFKLISNDGVIQKK